MKAGLLLALAACAPAAGPASPGTDRRAVPVEQEPRHRPVFANDMVRVLDVWFGPGDTTAYHVHSNRLVGVAVRDARTWTQSLGAEPDTAVNAAPVPYVFDNWSRAVPYTHRLANVDSVPIHYIVAERLGDWSGDAPALPDTPTRRLVKEGPFGRVYQVTLSAHAATEQHTHVAPGLTVLATAGALGAEGSPSAAAGGRGAGHWAWRGAGHRHVLRNDGPAALTLYEIDWR
jgi:hypothetical protein